MDRPLAGYMDNEDAAAHVLATNLCYRATPSAVHRFLPIFSFPETRGIDDLPSSSVRDPSGNVYYTSFPPGAFVLPYLAFQPSIVRLRLLAIALQMAAVAALALLLILMEAGPLASATAAVFYVAAPECLKSHTISYWAHQVYAPLFLIQIGLFLFRRRSWWLPAVALLSCLVEWTPYLVNAGMIALACRRYWQTREPAALRVALSLTLATCAAGVVLLLWYSHVTTLPEYLSALRYRAGVRTSGVSGLLSLLCLYVVSLGLFLSPLIAAVRAGFTSPMVSPPSWLGISRWRALFLVCAVAMTENLLLLSHANQYSFDRLKAVQVAALLTAWGISRAPALAPRIFRWSLATGLASIALFWFAYDYTQDFHSLDYTFHQRLGALIRETPGTSTNVTVRGELLYYARRNLSEYASPPDFRVSGTSVSHHGREVTLGYWSPKRTPMATLAFALFCGRVTDAASLRSAVRQLLSPTR